MATAKKIITPHAGFQSNFVRTGVDVCFGGSALGAGKALPINELVLTPTGWVQNGDLTVGDLVCTPFGTPARILQVFDHRDHDVYRITFNDGRVLECDPEHLWAVRTSKQMAQWRGHRDSSRSYSVIDTKDILRRYTDGEKTYVQIPDAQEFCEKEYVIPPYALGVMLGDGCMTESTWKRGGLVIISNNEEDVVEKFYKIVGGTKSVSGKYNYSKSIHTPNATAYYDYCTDAGLCTCSYNKFIPQEYLFGSIEQRKSLLAGLMDTDGNSNSKGMWSFSTTSTRLKDDFVHLCRSLGYQVRVHTDNRAEKYTSGVAYDINILTTDLIATSKKHCDRYAEYMAADKAFRRAYKHVYVASVEYIGKQDTRCILIDDKMHLYIAGDFVTTHNTYGAVLACAEPSLDPNWCGLFLRNNLGDAKAGGGILDTFRDVFGNSVRIRESGEPRVIFPSGAFVDVTHVDDQSRTVVDRRFKGRQYDMIYFDEGTGFTWECFTTILSRNRGRSKYAGRCLLTTNPEREHWIRSFIDWYVGNDGLIVPERSGIVRYFYMAGASVRDVVWGGSKEDVYKQCSAQINRQLDGVYGKGRGREKWPSMIKSFTFYLGKMSENKEMLEKNEGYVGSIAVAGGAEAAKKLEGNWNVSSRDDTDSLITPEQANKCFSADEQRNGDRWITCDLADVGTDNFIALFWDGFHVEDIVILPNSTPRQNAETLKSFARAHNVVDNHIIYDAIRGVYINDFIPEAVQFLSYHAPIGYHARKYMRLKDECYGKLVSMIHREMISFSDEVADKMYTHQLIKDDLTVRTEFVEECMAVRYKDGTSGKKQLLTKKEMNKALGRGRSMDLLDPCAMRMMPILDYMDADELKLTAAYNNEEEQELHDDEVDIYDESTWA